MNLQNNITSAPNFGSFRITKNAAKLLRKRDDLEAFKPVAADLKRLGKKYDIKIDAEGYWNWSKHYSIPPLYDQYNCTVEPKRPRIIKALVNNTFSALNFILNIDLKTLKGTSSISKKDKQIGEKFTTKDFKNLYNEAHDRLKDFALNKVERQKAKALAKELSSNSK